MHKGEKIWIFVGDATTDPARPPNPSAVFSTFEAAREWIAHWHLSGCLTSYIVDEPAFDRSLRLGRVSSKDKQRADKLRQTWSGGEEHAHFEMGKLITSPTPTP
jgi:hypothetical protein